MVAVVRTPVPSVEPRPPRPERRALSAERAQASVETLAAVPFVFVLGAIVWQLALAGHTAWQCAHAARVAARAEVVGQDGEAAARTALPDYLERGLDVEPRSEGGARVSVLMPMLSHRWTTSIPVSATASLGPEG